MAVAARRLGKHPIGLLVLSATELAERFSYYGMTALLSLYMVKQLLRPEHAANVWGLAALRGLFEFRGPMSDQAFASLIFGWYGGLVYFTPIVGGWIADRFLGTRRTVTLGALLMSAGHLAMSLDQTFLAALVLLIVGSGLLKGNISAQVGTLYPASDESLRERGFTIYSTAINIGATLGPIGAGGTQALYGFHAGFAVAAGLMLIALAVYLGGTRYLPKPSRRRETTAALPPLTREERMRTWGLVALIALLVPLHTSYTMIWNVGLVWVADHVSLASPLGTVPASWFNSVDSFASIVIAPVLVGLWAWQAGRKTEPVSLTKIGIGAVITGASALLLAAGSLTTDAAGKVSVLWPLLGWFGMGAAFMWYWPITLALISRAAPEKVNSTLMGGAFLSLFAGSIIMGWVGSFYDQMGNAAFWTLDAGIALAGALVIFAVTRPLTRALEPRQSEPHSPG
ncbi:MAG TPA: peptide MFS transporter [Sphingomicrobium sp.]|jgi:POT family proton-dependent oligopeptide transporter|nr:peptide MFS transporter [Sphingomicrobium sp.]